MLKTTIKLLFSFLVCIKTPSYATEEDLQITNLPAPLIRSQSFPAAIERDSFPLAPANNRSISTEGGVVNIPTITQIITPRVSEHSGQTGLVVFAREGLDRFPFRTIFSSVSPKQIVFIIPKAASEKERALVRRDKAYYSDVIELENYLDDKELYVKIRILRETFPFTSVTFHSERDPIRVHTIKREYHLPNAMSMDETLVFRDKWIMHQSFSKHPDVSLPASLSSSDEEEIFKFIHSIITDTGGEAFGKPRTGMGANGTKHIKTIGDLEDFLISIRTEGKNLEDYIFQEFINAPSYHIDMLTDREGVLRTTYPSEYYVTPFIVREKGVPLVHGIMEFDDPLTNLLIEYGKMLFSLFPVKGGSGIHAEVFVEKRPADEYKITFGEWAMRIAGSNVDRTWKIAFGVDLHYSSFLEQAGVGPCSFPSVASSQPQRPEKLAASVLISQVKANISQETLSALEANPSIETLLLTLPTTSLSAATEKKFSTDCSASFVVQGRTKAELNETIKWLLNNVAATVDREDEETKTDNHDEVSTVSDTNNSSTIEEDLDSTDL